MVSQKDPAIEHSSNPAFQQSSIPHLVAVHFGAGNIGRGFLGELYFESGFHTTFIDVNGPLVAEINARGEYPLRIVGDETYTKMIRDVSAIDGRDVDAVAQALSTATIASTAVGVNVLRHIAPALAAGLRLRQSPLDVIVCENLLHAGPYLREQVGSFENVGYVEASIGRMVPMMTPEQRAEDALLVCAEAYNDLPVDAEAFRGPIPAIKHLKPISNFEAYVERKLFVHNAGHASAAYFGWLRGCEFIWQTMQDPVVRPLVEGAMAESCKALSRRHGLSLPDLHDHAEDLVRRFQNKALGDTVARVAADPIRKLGPEDRLIGALRMCEDEAVDAPCLSLAISAALGYSNPQDPGAVRLVAMGAQRALTDVCGLRLDGAMAKAILNASDRLKLLGLYCVR